MPFNVKSISMSLAVVFFFMIAVIGSGVGLAPFTCCKRALLGAAAAYIVSGFLVRWINHMLIDAMLKSRLDQQNQE
ncbi:MAG: hypothetical protein ACYSUT_05850 [Planctomycetota bacterium]|jgi:hypothetical protein